MAIKDSPQIDLSTFGGGRNRKEDGDKIRDDQAQEQQNTSCTPGKFFPSKGDINTGNQISTNIPVKGIGTWDGRLVCANGTSIYQKTEDGDTWYVLLTGLTTTKQTDFLEYYNDLYITNAVDTPVRVVKTELTADVTIGDTTINVSDTAKLTATGTIYIDGDSITYTGVTATSLTGCVGALAHSSGDWVTQSSTPTNFPKGQFLEEYANKCWTSGVKKTLTLPTAPWRLYYGTTALATTPENFYDFTSLGSGQEFIAHGDEITALLKFKNNLLIGKKDEVEYIVGFDDTTTPPAPVRQQFFRQDGVVNFRCLKATENEVIYFTGKRIKKLFTPEGFDGIQIDTSFDDPIVDILESLDEDQSEACMVYNPKTFIMALSCKSSGSTYNNIKIEYNTKYDYWQVRTNQYASCYTVLNGNTYYGSDLVGEVRKDNTSLTVNEGSYPTYRLSKDYTFGDKNRIKTFIFFYIGGNISQNTEIILRIYVDNILVNTETINSDNIDNAVSSNGSFANAKFGAQTFGGGSESNGLYKFYEIYPIGVRGKSLTYSITSSGAGQDYEINSIAVMPQGKEKKHREPTA